jgi:hypothetical protein
MNRKRIHDVDIVEHEGTTYAEPLSGLRVSWGSILAGTLGIVAVSLILFALSSAVTLSCTHASMDSMKGTFIALFVCAIATTLIGSVVGGWFAGYLPGNRRRFVAGSHAFLAWALAFVLATAWGMGTLRGLAQTSTQIATTAAGAAAQTVGATASGIAGSPMTMDQKVVGILESLGYPHSEAVTMVEQGKSEIQSQLRSGPTIGPSKAGMANAADDALGAAAGMSWAWFGTWFISGLLAIAGGLAAASRLRRHRVVGEREVITTEPVVIAPATTPHPV